MAHILFAMVPRLYPPTPRQALEGVLGNLGHTVSFAADCEQAMICLQNKRPDVLAVDLALSDYRAADLVRQFVGEGAPKNVGVIALSQVSAEVGSSYRLLNTEFLRYFDDVIVRPYPDGVQHQNYAFAEQLLVSIGLLLHRLGKEISELGTRQVAGGLTSAAPDAPPARG